MLYDNLEGEDEWKVGEIKREGHRHTYGWLMLMCWQTPTQHCKKLSSNKNEVKYNKYSFTIIFCVTCLMNWFNMYVISFCVSLHKFLCILGTVIDSLWRFYFYNRNNHLVISYLCSFSSLPFLAEPCGMCGLSSPPGIKPALMPLEAGGHHRWTNREVFHFILLNTYLWLFLTLITYSGMCFFTLLMLLWKEEWEKVDRIYRAKPYPLRKDMCFAFLNFQSVPVSLKQVCAKLLQLCLPLSMLRADQFPLQEFSRQEFWRLSLFLFQEDQTQFYVLHWQVCLTTTPVKLS